jgi:hypothetical protein
VNENPCQENSGTLLLADERRFTSGKFFDPSSTKRFSACGGKPERIEISEAQRELKIVGFRKDVAGSVV